MNRIQKAEIYSKLKIVADLYEIIINEERRNSFIEE